MLSKKQTPCLLHQDKLQVDSQLSALSDVLQWFDSFNRPPVDRTSWLECQTALAEGFTNAVRYAHKHLPKDTPIDIEVFVYSQYLELRIWDYGLPFPLEDKLAEIPSQLDPNSTGGRGLQIIQRIADRLSYVRTGDRRNCFSITKRYANVN